MRNLSRVRAVAIQPGALPNPVQVLPVLGSRYFAMPAPFRTALALPPLSLPAAAFDALAPWPKSCSTDSPNVAMVSLSCATTLVISVARSAAACFSSLEISALICL